MNSRRGNPQQGAALVEMAIVILLFLMLVFGIFEFALVVFHWSRLDEATRAGARYAIVNDPACSVYEVATGAYNCTGGPLDCSSNPNDKKVVVENGACTVGNPYTLNDAGCRIVERMRGIQPLINSSETDVVITYACTDTGFAGNAAQALSVTVGTCDDKAVADGVNCKLLKYKLILPGLLGIDASVTMPAFSTTRTGEDMNTVN